HKLGYCYTHCYQLGHYFELHESSQVLIIKNKIVKILVVTKRGENEGAAAKYREALGLLEQLTLQEKPGEPEWVELDMARVPFFVNLAQCQFRLKLKAESDQSGYWVVSVIWLTLEKLANDQLPMAPSQHPRSQKIDVANDTALT
ncbi:hypothetical protein PHET_04317, partial [Paragonimus heterotremus]